MDDLASSPSLSERRRPLSELSLNNVPTPTPTKKRTTKTGSLPYRQTPSKVAKTICFERSRRFYRLDILSDLPDDVRFGVLSFIPICEVIRAVSILSTRWSTFCNSQFLWSAWSDRLTVEERYRKMELLVERRSKGKLFKCLDRVTGQLVAVRRIQLDVANAGNDDGVPTSLLRELSLLRCFECPYVAKLYSVEVDGLTVSVCSEFGVQTLRSLCSKDSSPLTRPNIQRLLGQILLGLQYCHQNGVMHRNMKSDNIFIGQDGLVKIADFGLSRHIDIPLKPYTPEDPKERERSGREARRLWYRPADVLLRCSRYSFEVDMWACGCILAELVLRCPLFTGETEIEQLFRIFRFLGAPDAHSWPEVVTCAEYKLSFPQWQTVKLSSACSDRDSDTFRALEMSLSTRPDVLERLLELSEVLGEDGMHLLERLLDMNPNTRITATAALQHPFFFSAGVPSHLGTPDLSPPPNWMPAVGEPLSQQICSLPLAYLESILRRWRTLEVSCGSDCRYLDRQPQLNEAMRSILVDWLADVHIHFDLSDQSLHLAVAYIDRFLSLELVPRTKLQLAGVVCIKVADVYHEISKEYYKQDNAREYAYITADEYNTDEVVEMEKLVLRTLRFCLQVPTTMSFLTMYIAVSFPSNGLSAATYSLAMFLADVSLLEYSLLQYPPSLLALCCLAVACRVHHEPLGDLLDVSMAKRLFAWHSLAEVESCVRSLLTFWKELRSATKYSQLDALKNKYNKNRHQYVSNISPLSVHETVVSWLSPWIWKE